LQSYGSNLAVGAGAGSLQAGTDRLVDGMTTARDVLGLERRVEVAGTLASPA